MPKNSAFLFLLLCFSCLFLNGCLSSNRSVEFNSNKAVVVPSNNTSNIPALGEEQLPLFPYPPSSSASVRVPSRLLVKPDKETTFRDVDLTLQEALVNEGYEKWGYYRVPLEGSNFVLTTALEQFSNNGTPRYGAERFTENPAPLSVFSPEFFENLLRGRTGRYRLIAFVITNTAVAGEGEDMPVGDARTMTARGSDRLPPGMWDLLFTDRHLCTAYIYEFGKDRKDGEVRFVKRSSLNAEQHINHLLKRLRGN